MGLMVPPAFAEEPPRVDLAQLPQSVPPYLELAALDTNTANVFRTLVPANETAGIAQILTLVGRGSLEEQWAFVPAKGLWIEIGHNEMTSELDSEVETDVDYLKSIVRLYHEVRIFHFHPASYYARVLPIGLSVAGIRPEDVESIGYALPSPTDIVTSLRLTELLYAADPLANISYSVISPHGVVAYGMTSSGFKTIHYEGDHPRATTARSIITRIAIRRMTFNIARTIEVLDAPTIGDVIDDLCAQASDENYVVKFTPF
jgi:hypothetical protein